MIESETLDLVVVGECPLDVLMDWSPPIRRPGGACYSGCAASALGARVGIMSDVGADIFEGELTQVAAMGVDISGIEVVDSESAIYRIFNCAEIVPQLVNASGVRSRKPRSTHIPDVYKTAKNLLVYPYQKDVVMPLVEDIKRHDGRVYFDLQHDIAKLTDWQGRRPVNVYIKSKLVREFSRVLIEIGYLLVAGRLTEAADALDGLARRVRKAAGR